ncbi:MAG TPA: ATP-binding protein [Burkholderiaceae bacterium]
MDSSSLGALAAPPHTAAPGAERGFAGWRAWAAAAAAGLAALLLRPLLAPVLGNEATLVLAYPATVIAAWCGGFWPGAVVTLALALLMPALPPVPWDTATVGRVLIYLPFGLLISALSQSLHDARERLQRRADGLAVQALSEQRLATTLEDTGVALFELDAELRCRWVQNAQALGLDAGHMIGATVFDQFDTAETRRLTDARRRVLETGRPLRGEFAWPMADGVRWFEHSISALRDANGGVVGLRCAASDVTERRAERERQRNEVELFRVAQDQSLDPFEVLRPITREGRTVDFVWEYANGAAAAFFDTTPDRLVGCRVLADPDDRYNAARCAHWIAVMDGGVPRRADFSREQQDTIGWYQTLSVSLGDRLAVQTRDVTAQTRWLNAERAARAELQRTSKLKDEFLANLSHELRTPLNAIVGWAHLLARPDADAGLVERAADAINRNARAQAVLVDDLLDMNRIITGTLRVVRQRCDIGAALLRAVDTVMPSAQAKWIALDTVNVASGATCIGDPDRLEQVFWNLLTNAVKYTPLNGSVHVALAAGDDTSTVEIRDTGEGIAADVLPHVFDRFQQADSSISRRQGGLGIGLTIVRSLVELHGGKVSIDSPGVGQGTTVRVELPRADIQAVREANGAAPAAAAPPPDGVPETGLRRLTWRRILVVEDQADSLELMSVLLRQEGAIVRAFDNAEQALAAAENGTFDLIISDLGMPGMNGLDFMRRLRLRPLPVKAIALTAYADEAPRREALDAGFARVEIKPISPPHFLEVVVAEVGRPAWRG